MLLPSHSVDLEISFNLRSKTALFSFLCHCMFLCKGTTLFVIIISIFLNIIMLYYECKYCVIQFVIYKRNICNKSSYLHLLFSFRYYRQEMKYNFKSLIRKCYNHSWIEKICNQIKQWIINKKVIIVFVHIRILSPPLWDKW